MKTYFSKKNKKKLHNLTILYVNYLECKIFFLEFLEFYTRYFINLLSKHNLNLIFLQKKNTNFFLQ